MFDPRKMMQAAQKLQQQLAHEQERLGEERVEATSGGGVVRVVANGHGEVQELAIDPQAVDPGDVALLQDLIIAAVNEAHRKAKTLTEERLRGVTGGLGLDGLPGLPF